MGGQELQVQEGGLWPQGRFGQIVSCSDSRLPIQPLRRWGHTVQGRKALATLTLVAATG